MATRLKPSRINVDNTPSVGDGAAYQNDNDFHWSMGGGDMSYRDFEWHTLTGTSLVIEDISNNVTPSSDFTVSAGTVKPGIEYILRVNTGNTPYTMTLGTGVTNPNSYKTELKPNTVNQFKFIATSTNQLELEGVDSAVVSEINWGEIDGTLSNQTDLQNALNTKADNTDVNTKTFYLSSTSDLTNAQAAYDWYLAGKNPIIVYDRKIYTVLAQVTTYLEFVTSIVEKQNTTKDTYTYQRTLRLNHAGDSTTITSINTPAKYGPYALLTDVDYSSPYTPLYNGSPATKKYVDDQVSAATSSAVSDTAYGSSWDGVTGIAPSKNAVYDKISTMDTAISGNTTNINTINSKIPSEASATNQLADKDFVGDSINSVTAYYITKNANGDQFATYAELAAATTFYSGGVVRVPTKNDYTIVLDDENHDHATTRYIYNNGWEYQYTINETPLTQAQLNALNSGITAGKVSTYDGYATSKQDKLVNQSNIKSINNNSLLGSGNLALNDVKVSSTAPASPTEGMVWYDTTNDQLKVYDGSQWQVTGKEYNAGPGISIGQYQDYSAMRGPCPEGFHVPTNSELQNIINIGNALSAWSTPAQCEIILNLTNHNKINWQGGYILGLNGAFIWSCTANNSGQSYVFSTAANQIQIRSSENRNNGYQIRPFKDKPVIPDNTRTTLFDGSSTAAGAGIFSNSLLGLISLSSDGENRTTIAIKNLGAPDTTSAGYYYQRGNNNGFVANGYTTSETTVNASNYGPMNYYNSNVFIMGNNGVWDNSNNRNLRGGVTGVVTLENAITNTGVLSVNGQTGDVTINAGEASSIATTQPSNPVEGDVYYDTTNDVVKVYDGTNWNVTGKEYNAGEGIEIKNGPDYSAMQGPASDGFHVPLSSEWQSIIDMLTTLGLITAQNRSLSNTNLLTYLKASGSGFLDKDDGSAINLNSSSCAYWCCDKYTDNAGYSYYFSSGSSIVRVYRNVQSMAYAIRAFKDIPIIPNNTWTTLYDGSSIATGAGIFHNASLGLISISSNGNTYITIQDKDVGASSVWNYGDTKDNNNCGKKFQRGNNYGFPRQNATPTSSTQVDASNYGPGNYYSSSTFITQSGRTSWDSSDNGNLWGWVTGVATYDNAIINTGVLSINGQTGNITIETFQLAPNSPLTPKYRRYGTQAQYEALTQYYTDEAGDTVYFTI